MVDSRRPLSSMYQEPWSLCSALWTGNTSSCSGNYHFMIDLLCTILITYHTQAPDSSFLLTLQYTLYGKCVLIFHFRFVTMTSLHLANPSVLPQLDTLREAGHHVDTFMAEDKSYPELAERLGVMSSCK